MTSRNSFFNLLKEDFRRRLWTFILSSLVFFATFVIAFTMVLQNYVSRFRMTNGYTKEELIDLLSGRICSDFYDAYPWFILVAVVGAIICGMNGFAYLHSRKQMDFYHSLPVKRETIFAVRFVNGILIYAVPYLVGLLYTFILSAVFGVMTTDIFYCGLFFFVVHLMGYIIMYLVTIIAMVLTGKMVMGFFGICVLNLYAPAIYALVLNLKEIFFVTSYSNSVDIEDALLITRWISPTSYYFSLITAINEDGSKFWLEFLSFLLMAAVLTAVALWLYKKRASEKADTAMSFKATEPVIRVMLALPIGILTGLMFFAIQYDYGLGTSVFWLVFGGLLGGFLAHGVIEALYNGDIKKCLSHKVQMLATMVLAAVIPLMFMYDIFGYDSYLPEKEEIASMAVSSGELRFGGSYYDEEGWVNPTEYALENMEVTNIDAMYELAALLAKDAGENRAEKFFGYSGTYYVIGGTEKIHNTNFIIRYNLKNGSEVTRSYTYNYYAVLDLLERMYNDDEFKTAVHPIFSLIETGWEPLYIECYAPATGVSVKLEKNCEAIMQTYAEEVLAMDFDTLKETAAIGELTVYFTMDVGHEYTDTGTFLIYPSMTRTIALLKEQGYNMQSVQDTTGTNVTNITVYYSGTLNSLKQLLGMEVEGVEEYAVETYENSAVLYEKYGDLVMPVTAETYQEIIVEFTDPAEIEEIKKGLVYSSYVSEFGPFPERVSYLNTEVSFEASAGSAYTSGLLGWMEMYRFVEGGVPQFVIDRIFEEFDATIE